MSALSGTATTEIDAPIETVWAIVQDVESAPAWQRGIDSMRALEHDDAGERLAPTPSRTCRSRCSTPASASHTSPQPG